MGHPDITVARVAELCARLLKRESQSSLKRTMKMSPKTVTRALAVLRQHGVAVDTIPKSRLDPDRRAALFNYFRTTQLSNRQIVTATGATLDTVNKARKKYNAELIQAGSELPKCECGQYLHHARMCWARRRQHMKDQGIRAVVTLEPFEQEDVRRRLLAGATMRSEAERTNLPKTSIATFLRTFSRDERSQRNDCFVVASARRRAAKLSRSIARPRAISPTADPLYAKIAHSVPRAIDAALRDDMISQAYLEVLEGRLDPKCLSEGVKKVRGRVFRQFANPWGNRSLDVSLSDDGGATLAEMVPDEGALRAFEAIK